MARFALTDWQVAQLRLTAFPVVPLQAQTDVAWATVEGFEPDERSVKKAEATASGPFGAGKLTLQIQPQRVDWLLQPADLDLGELIANPQLPSVGQLQEALEQFQTVTHAWLRNPAIPDLNRLAFGLVVLAPVTDKRSGYMKLPEYVPVRVNPESSDFLYQINRPVRSRRATPALTINRLSKWSVLAMHIGAMLSALPADIAATFPKPVIQRAALSAFRIELDINNGIQSDPLANDQLIPLYEDFVAEALQIIELGDVE